MVPIRIAAVVIADVEDNSLVPLTYCRITNKLYPVIDDVMDDLKYALNTISLEYEIKEQKVKI